MAGLIAVGAGGHDVVDGVVPAFASRLKVLCSAAEPAPGGCAWWAHGHPAVKALSALMLESKISRALQQVGHEGLHMEWNVPAPALRCLRAPERHAQAVDAADKPDSGSGLPAKTHREFATINPGRQVTSDWVRSAGSQFHPDLRQRRRLQPFSPIADSSRTETPLGTRATKRRQLVPCSQCLRPTGHEPIRCAGSAPMDRKIAPSIQRLGSHRKRLPFPASRQAY